MEANYFTILYWFCHISRWIRHGCTRVPHPEPLSHLPPHTTPLSHPSAPAPSTLYHASNLDWLFVSHMIIYMFQCHSPKPSHPLPLPQSPKVCSIHLCLFCCLAYRVIIIIFCSSGFYACFLKISLRIRTGWEIIKLNDVSHFPPGQRASGSRAVCPLWPPSPPVYLGPDGRCGVLPPPILPAACDAGAWLYHGHLLQLQFRLLYSVQTDLPWGLSM